MSFADENIDFELEKSQLPEVNPLKKLNTESEVLEKYKNINYFRKQIYES